jgi:hypothetical protein
MAAVFIASDRQLVALWKLIEAGLGGRPASRENARQVEDLLASRNWLDTLDLDYPIIVSPVDPAARRGLDIIAQAIGSSDASALAFFTSSRDHAP